jgi:predicted TIM-barrel fold metal-dependent hydrolase
LGEVDLQYDGISPADPRMDEYWALASELDVPVALHLGEGYPGVPYDGGLYRVGLGHPFELEEVLVRHPDLRLYVMHYGSPLVEEMIGIMYAYPNVYIDVGGNLWPYPREFVYDQLRRFVDAGFGKRILFGSDQMRWAELIEESIRVIEEAPFLTEQQKRDILYNNAADFFRISEEDKVRHHGRGGPEAP